MSADSPAEYVQKLQAENRALRRSLVEAVNEKQKLELQLAQCVANALKYRAVTLDDLMAD
jgi:hypothetical protein